MQKNEDVMQITLNLTKKLNVDIEEEDISIAHRLPRKRRGQTRANKATNHSIIIVRLTDKFDVLRGRLVGNHNDFHWQLGGQINHQPCSYKAARVIRCTELDSAVSSF